MYDKLLKPRQSFRITLYTYAREIWSLEHRESMEVLKERREEGKMCCSSHHEEMDDGEKKENMMMMMMMMMEMRLEWRWRSR